MAVEDSAVLAESISFIDKKEDLHLALKLVESMRISRTKRVQEASLYNGGVIHMLDGPEQEARDAAMRPSVEGKPYSRSPYGISDPETQRWCYGYDVVQDVRQRWLRPSSL